MTRELFNNDWYFCETSLQSEFQIKDIFNPSLQWHAVDIPHDWLIYNSKKLYRDSEGWYKKKFVIDGLDKSNQYILEFGGIYMDSTIYINNQKCFEWKYGYTNQIVDITQFLVEGENEIFVRVRYESPNSRWYSGAGIYRSIYLYKESPIYISPYDYYITAKPQQSNNLGGVWQVEVSASISNPKTYTDEVTISIGLEKDGVLNYFQEQNVKIDTRCGEFKTHFFVNNPKLWSPESPNLYELFIKVSGQYSNQKIKKKMGFKFIELTSDKGAFINGKQTKIKGVCQHHDLGALGAAENESALRRQLLLLKKMGVNAIRTAHNPFSTCFLELADELGFLVQSEFTDVWKHGKTKYDYSRFFEEWVEKDVASWIKQDRNHACVFMWSVGNEIYDTHGRTDALETLNLLIDLVKEYDPGNNAFITFGSNYLLWEPTQKIADSLKVVGYNYSEKLYENHHKIYPDWIIYGSETGSVTQSRGVYHFPLEQSTLADDDFQCSSLGNSSTSWGAKSIEECIIKDRDITFSLGQFIWTGTDYIGEPTPYHTKNSYLGQIDTAGFPKDSFYIFQSAWTSYKDNPMIHLFPYWDFSEGQLIDVSVCSNAPILELFFNEQSMGKIYNDTQNGEKLLHSWKIPYRKGYLKAIAYDETEKIIAVDTQQSFGDVVQLKANVIKDKIAAGSSNLIFIEVSGLDANGNEVANANNRVFFNVSGVGRLVGIDNGDSTDYESYKGNTKCLFNGKLLAMIGTTNQLGKIMISISSPGLLSEEIEIVVSEKLNRVGLSNAYERNENTIEKWMFDDVPIRKIELISSESNRVLSRKKESLEILAKCFPLNANKEQLYWRVTDEKGIDSDIVEYDIKNSKINLRARMNGSAYVRCGVKNGKEHLDFYSLLEFKVKNMKEQYFNPYSFISAGQYSYSNVELTNGNERGIATLRDGESWITFNNVEFGDKGSSVLKLDLFSLTSEPFEIQVWQGIPYEDGSEKIDTVLYTKGSIWNTYQDEVFQLSKPFTGRQVITFVFHQKVHMKGFVFQKPTDSGIWLNILDSDLIYGDHFEIKKNRVENIGNNVTFVFEKLEFGDKGVSTIEIKGQSPQFQNSIHLKIESENKVNTYILDFNQSDEYKVLNFLLDEEGIRGECKVEFLFLPGSKFNFQSFCFK